MKTWVHFSVSLILAILFYPVFNWKVLFILVGGVLVDVDHYIRYIFKYKDLNIFKCYNHYLSMYKKNNFDECKDGLFVFHTIEFFVIVAVLSFFSEFAGTFAIGLLSHYLLDIIWHMNVPKRIVANHSAISWILNQKL